MVRSLSLPDGGRAGRPTAVAPPVQPLCFHSLTRSSMSTAPADSSTSRATSTSGSSSTSTFSTAPPRRTCSEYALTSKSLSTSPEKKLRIRSSSPASCGSRFTSPSSSVAVTWMSSSSMPRCRSRSAACFAASYWSKIPTTVCRMKCSSSRWMKGRPARHPRRDLLGGSPVRHGGARPAPAIAGSPVGVAAGSLP